MVPFIQSICGNLAMEACNSATWGSHVVGHGSTFIMLHAGVVYCQSMDWRCRPDCSIHTATQSFELVGDADSTRAPLSAFGPPTTASCQALRQVRTLAFCCVCLSVAISSVPRASIMHVTLTRMSFFYLRDAASGEARRSGPRAAVALFSTSDF